MGIALRHDRRLMPQEPLHLVQIHSALDHMRGTGMAEVVEMEVGHLRFLQREMQTATDVACIQPCQCFAREHQFRVHRMAKRFRLRRESFVLERAEGYVKVLKNRLSGFRPCERFLEHRAQNALGSGMDVLPPP